MRALIVVSFLVVLLAGCAPQSVRPPALKPSSPPPPGSQSPVDASGKPRPWQRPYSVFGEQYQPLQSHEGFVETGVASWYGSDFHGKKTSNGEIYNMHDMTAAHKLLPLGVFVKVTNLDNGRETLVRVNDRGPFVKKRIIDLSYAAADSLGVVGPGTAKVRVEALGYQVRDEAGRIRYSAPERYDAGPFAVQVGSFGVRENALRLSHELKGRYGRSDIQEARIDNRTFYRVRAGHYGSLEDAERGREDIARAGYGDGLVVALD